MNDKNEKEDKKKYNHDDLSIPFFGKKKEEVSSPDVIDANLFKQVEEQKEDKTKEVLQLEHAMIVEDENYEYPPIELLKFSWWFSIFQNFITTQNIDKVIA